MIVATVRNLQVSQVRETSYEAEEFWNERNVSEKSLRGKIILNEGIIFFQVQQSQLLATEHSLT